MKTKYFYIVSILMLTTTMVMAQNTDNGKTSFGILGGVNFQNFNGKDFSGDKLENDMTIGYHAGVNMQIPIAPEFYFQPGLLFSTKGAKNTNVLITSTYQISYIELPLNLVYKGLLGNGYVKVGFGPYLSYGVMGKAKHEGGAVAVSSDIEFKNDIVLGDLLTTSYFKPFDAGGNVFIGYEMASGIFFQLNSQIGMLNINPENKLISGDKSEVRNTGFGLSLGYQF